MTLLVAVLFFGLAGLGMPIAFALGLASIGGLLHQDMSLGIMAAKMRYSVDSFPFMAIPFFMLAGELLVMGGLVKRLTASANALVGHFRGGLAQVTVVSGIGLASVSGAAVADAAALGSAIGRPMGRLYGVPFASAIIAASANLGPILPPSTAMIIYATLAGSSVSISRLFAAGIVPGLMIAITTMFAVAVIARRRRFAATSEGFAWRPVFCEAYRAFWVLLMPPVVIGGILFGAFTATEGGAVAVAWAFLVGLFVTRELKLRDVPRALSRAVVTTAVVGALIAFAAPISFLFSINQVPQDLGAFISGLTTDPTVFLLLVMVFLIAVGMFVEPASAYIMLVPVFAPIVEQFGVDPVHFAMIFVLTLVVGMLTPPVGTLLFLMCGINNITMAALITQLWPFIVIQFAVVLICLFVPELVLFLPGVLLD